MTKWSNCLKNHFKTRISEAENLQNEFERSFILFMSHKAGKRIVTAQEAFDLYEMTEEKLSSAIWVEISKMIHYPAKKLHDYYHNTFSKRFCSDLNKVKSDAIRFFDECPPLTQKR